MLPSGAMEEECLDEECLAMLSSALKEKGLGDIVDATTGQILRGELVKKARELEMQYFRDKDVYQKRGESGRTAYLLPRHHLKL